MRQASLVIIRQDACNTKIGQNEPAISMEQEIGRLEISVDDPLLVCIIQRFRGLFQIGQCLSR